MKSNNEDVHDENLQSILSGDRSECSAASENQYLCVIAGYLTQDGDLLTAGWMSLV